MLWTQLGLSSTWEGKEEEALAEAWLVSEELGDLGCGRPGGTCAPGRRWEALLGLGQRQGRGRG